MLSGHLPALTGELQQPVLVDRVFQPIWQPQFAQGLQPFQVGQHMGYAGNRTHGTTKTQPLALFAETEKHILRPLPDVPPELAVWAKVKLHGNCHVEFRRLRIICPRNRVNSRP